MLVGKKGEDGCGGKNEKKENGVGASSLPALASGPKKNSRGTTVLSKFLSCHSCFGGIKETITI